MARYGGSAVVVPEGEPVFVCPHVYAPEIASDVWHSLGDGIVGAPGEVPPDYEGAVFHWLAVCSRCVARPKAEGRLAAASGVLTLGADARPTRFA